MTTPDMHRVARLMGYDPNYPSSWPKHVINRLLAFEKFEGPEAMKREINRLMGKGESSHVDSRCCSVCGQRLDVPVLRSRRALPHV